MRRFIKSPYLTVLLVACIFWGCGPKIYYYQPQGDVSRAEINEGRLKKVALLQVQGGLGHIATDKLYLHLGNSFALMDKRETERIIKESGWPEGDSIGEETAVQMGKLAGADAVILGNASLEKSKYTYSLKLRILSIPDGSKFADFSATGAYNHEGVPDDDKAMDGLAANAAAYLLSPTGEFVRKEKLPFSNEGARWKRYGKITVAAIAVTVVVVGYLALETIDIWGDVAFE